MGDLSTDTAVRSLGNGRYEATMSRDWEIWGPMGGYVAACALRAAGASTPDLRPAAFSCHYLSVAKFAPVQLQVTTRKQGRTAVSQRVEMTQDDRSILDAMETQVRTRLGEMNDLLASGAEHEPQQAELLVTGSGDEAFLGDGVARAVE